MADEATHPLSGVRVVDLTSNVAAPFATAVLADLGADVIHVESPDGDDCRRMAPTTDSSSAYFQVVNRNKQGAVLDIRDEADFQGLMQMIANADVFVTNLRPGKLERLGLDGASLRARFPRLIHASLSAYGPVGAERDKPGYDAVLQARTGIASVTGTTDGPPVRVGVSILDVGAGTWLALGIIAALYHREQTGVGGEVATSLFETGASWASYHVAAHQVTGLPSKRHGSGHPAFSPYGIFQTGNGEICIGIGSDDRGDVASFHNDAGVGALSNNGSKVLDQVFSHLRVLGYGRNGSRNITASNRLGNIGAIDMEKLVRGVL